MRASDVHSIAVGLVHQKKGPFRKFTIPDVRKFLLVNLAKDRTLLASTTRMLSIEPGDLTKIAISKVCVQYDVDSVPDLPRLYRLAEVIITREFISLLRRNGSC